MAVSGLLLALSVTPFAPGWAAAAVRCDRGNVTIATEHIDDAALICSAVEKAKAFLEACAIDTNTAISIVVNSARTAELEYYGSFDSSTNLIWIPSREAAAARLSGDKNRPSIDPTEHYWSVVVHEVMHRLTFHVTQGNPIPRSSHEYLAYVAHFDAMSEKSREGLLKRYYVHRRSILPDDLLLVIDPVAFAALSYFHFQEAGDRCATIRRVLNGQLKFEHYDE